MAMSDSLFAWFIWIYFELITTYTPLLFRYRTYGLTRRYGPVDDDDYILLPVIFHLYFFIFPYAIYSISAYMYHFAVSRPPYFRHRRHTDAYRVVCTDKMLSMIAVGAIPLYYLFIDRRIIFSHEVCTWKKISHIWYYFIILLLHTRTSSYILMVLCLLLGTLYFVRWLLFK